MDATVAALQRLLGRLEVLVQVHANLPDDMEEYLEGTGTPEDLSPAR